MVPRVPPSARYVAAGLRYVRDIPHILIDDGSDRERRGMATRLPRTPPVFAISAVANRYQVRRVVN